MQSVFSVRLFVFTWSKTWDGLQDGYKAAQWPERFIQVEVLRLVGGEQRKKPLRRRGSLPVMLESEPLKGKLTQGWLWLASLCWLWPSQPTDVDQMVAHLNELHLLTQEVNSKKLQRWGQCGQNPWPSGLPHSS